MREEGVRRADAGAGPELEPGAIGAGIWSDLPFSSAASSACSGREAVVFYRLGRKFVDSEGSIPEGASEVLYYTLSVGHHTGVIDCFERALSMPLESYRKIVALVPDEEARFKLAGVDRFAEIEIDKSHVPRLLPALQACQAAVASDGQGAGSALDELEVQELDALVDLLVKVRDEPALYVTARRIPA